MAKNTKAFLEAENKQLKKELKRTTDSYQDLWDKADEYKGHNASLIRKMSEMMDEHMALETKHDIFVQKYRTICAEHSRQVGILRDNLEIHSKELQEAKARAEQQATKLMVAETAMQSMTIHIHLLTNQKGQNNA